MVFQKKNSWRSRASQFIPDLRTYPFNLTKGSLLTTIFNSVCARANQRCPQIIADKTLTVKLVCGKQIKKSLGNDLLSQGAAPQVPSALTVLTAGFGM